MNNYVVIDGWRSNIRFSSAHIIHEYEKCGRLHGHTYAIHVKIFGEPDEKGIIIDFSILKKILRDITNDLDHKLLIPNKSKILKINKEKNNILIKGLGKEFSIPESDCFLLPIKSTSAENLSDYIFNRLIKDLPVSNNIKKIELGVDEGYGQGARILKDI